MRIHVLCVAQSYVAQYMYKCACVDAHDIECE